VKYTVTCTLSRLRKISNGDDDEKTVTLAVPAQSMVLLTEERRRLHPGWQIVEVLEWAEVKQPTDRVRPVAVKPQIAVYDCTIARFGKQYTSQGGDYKGSLVQRVYFYVGDSTATDSVQLPVDVAQTYSLGQRVKCSMPIYTWVLERPTVPSLARV
jgi:hypothetical protein